MRILFKIFSSMALLISASTASAAISDPAADFLLTYAGPANSDVDIISADVAFNGSAFSFSETMNGPVGTTPNSLFVWAINRGAGVARPALAPPVIGSTLLWDAVVVMFPDGTLRVVTFPAAGPPSVINIAGGTSVTGSSLSALVSLSLLPSTGFAPTAYTFELWSRVRVNPAADGLTSEIADLTPNGGPIVAAVPEPATWLSMLLGFGLIGVMLRWRSNRTALLDR
jgi:hypothetical protein